MSRRRFLQGVGALGLAAAGSGFLAACGAGDGGGAAGPAEGEDLKMGMVLPLTGLLASSYIPLFSNAQVAIDEINADGGILGHQISVEKEDDQGSPAKEPQVMQKLIGNGVDFVIGPSGSTQTLASLAVSTKAQVLQGPWGNDYAIGDGSKYPYCYQCVYNTVQEGELFSRYLVQTAGLKKIGILQENTAFGVAGAKASLDALKKLGVEPVSTQVYAIDQTDLSGYVGNLKQAGAEGVIAWIANSTNSAAAFRAMNALQWQPTVAGHSGVAFKGLFDFLPPEQLQKIYSIQYKNFTWTGNEDLPSELKAYAQKLLSFPDVAKLGGASVIQAPYYDWVYILKHAIEQANSFDTTKVKKVLDQLSDYKGRLATFNFTEEDHHGTKLDSLTLGVVGSMTDPRSSSGMFLQRAPGL